MILSPFRTIKEIQKAPAGADLQSAPYKHGICNPKKMFFTPVADY